MPIRGLDPPFAPAMLRGRGFPDRDMPFVGPLLVRLLRRAHLPMMMVVVPEDAGPELCFREPGGGGNTFTRNAGPEIAGGEDPDDRVDDRGTVELFGDGLAGDTGREGQVGDEGKFGSGLDHRVLSLPDPRGHDDAPRPTARLECRSMADPSLMLVRPVEPEDTPQKLPRRGVKQLWTRDKIDVYRPEHDYTLAAIMRTPKTVSPLDFINTLTLHLGYSYGFWDRCGGSRHQHDCSGYQCWAANMLGVGYGCVSSFVIAQWCWSAGLIISEEEARHTRGVFAFHGPNGGRGPSQRPNGADGHIVCCDVPGSGGTLEAMGRAYGVCRGRFDGRRWVAYAKIPGVNYAPPTFRERDMILQPGKKSTVPGQDAYVIPAGDGSCVECWNGASIAHDQPVGGALRRWTPVKLGGNKIVGATFRPADKEDPHDGIAAADNTGQVHRGHFS